LEFLSTNVPLTPHHISIGQEVTLISNALHASKVFTTPIATFRDMPNQQKIVAPMGLQILIQVELMEVACVELVEKIINQPAIKS